VEFDLVIIGGRVYLDGKFETRNIGVLDGRVAALAVEPLRARAGGTRIDAAGRLVYPGTIDTHVHFRDPGRTDKEDFGTGTAAAAAGGVTTVLDIQNNIPLTTDADVARAKLEEITPKARVDFGIYGSVGVQNLDKLAGMADYVVAYKAFMTKSVGPLTVTDLGDLSKAFSALRGLGRVFTIHAESDAIVQVAKEGLPDHIASHVKSRPRVAEWVAVAEALELCREYRVPLNIPHISTGRAAMLVGRAKEDGLPVSGATCAHYLHFTDDDVVAGGAEWKVNPPIKFAEDREILLQAVKSGVVDHVHSDHAPHTREEKSKNFNAVPSGIPGVQHQLPALLDLAASGRIGYEDVGRLLCDGPARAFGLSAGRLYLGSPADIVIVDPSGETVSSPSDLLSKTGHSIWCGRRVRGAVDWTLLKGAVVWSRTGGLGEGVRGTRVFAQV
jgi:allantoinase